MNSNMGDTRNDGKPFRSALDSNESDVHAFQRYSLSLFFNHRKKLKSRGGGIVLTLERMTSAPYIPAHWAPCAGNEKYDPWNSFPLAIEKFQTNKALGNTLDRICVVFNLGFVTQSETLRWMIHDKAVDLTR